MGNPMEILQEFHGKSKIFLPVFPLTHSSLTHFGGQRPYRIKKAALLRSHGNEPKTTEGFGGTRRRMNPKLRKLDDK